MEHCTANNILKYEPFSSLELSSLTIKVQRERGVLNMTTLYTHTHTRTHAHARTHTHTHTHRHLLVVFGGLKGLEYSLESDDHLQMKDVSLLFNHYLNTCPEQGSRTIRTEVFTSLTSLKGGKHDLLRI